MRATLVLLAIAAETLASTACAPTVSTTAGLSPVRSAPADSDAIPKPSATALVPLDLEPKQRGWLRKKGNEGSLIYVASGGQVNIFPEYGFNQGQVGTITDGVLSAYGLFVDGKRDLFVANAGTITAYHPGDLHPYFTYNDSARPLYVVKDHSGRIYASNQHGGGVSEYLPGQSGAYRTLQTPGVEADGLNLDDAGNLYVAYRDQSGSGSIEKFPAHSTNGVILGMQLDQPQGLQLDGAGNILVVETGSKQAVDIFPPGSQSPSQIVPAAYGVTQVVLRAAGENMYVSNFANENVYISHYPPGEFQLKIDTNEYTQGMALSNEAR